MRHRTTDEDIVKERYARLTNLLIERGLTISTMESATAGQLASLITDTEGASAVMRGGLVTYCNEMKIKMGVSADTIEQHGVYSKETACEMAAVVKKLMDTNISIGVTGTFGNADPANADSEPGVVYYCILMDQGIVVNNGDMDYMTQGPDGSVMILRRMTLEEKNSRHAYKFLMAGIIAHDILKALQYTA